MNYVVFHLIHSKKINEMLQNPKATKTPKRLTPREKCGIQPASPYTGGNSECPCEQVPTANLAELSNSQDHPTATHPQRIPANPAEQKFGGPVRYCSSPETGMGIAKRGTSNRFLGREVPERGGSLESRSKPGSLPPIHMETDRQMVPLNGTWSKPGPIPRTSGSMLVGGRRGSKGQSPETRVRKAAGRILWFWVDFHEPDKRREKSGSESLLPA